MTTHVPKIAALMAYDADLLSNEGERILEGHLARCALCTDALAAIRVYDRVSGEIVNAPVPTPDWNQMDFALRREAREQSRAAKRRASDARSGFFAGVGVAAAVLLGFVFEASAMRFTPSDAEATSELRAGVEPIAGTVTAVAGRVRHHQRLGSLLDANLDDTLGSGDSIETGEASALHAELESGTQIVIGAKSNVLFSRMQNDAIELALVKGEISNLVHPLAKNERFEIAAGAYEISVKGTRFSVKRDNQAVAVRVDEGVVEVSRNGEVVSRVSAPGTWASEEAIAPVAVAAPISNAASSVEIAADPRMATWQWQGVSLSARDRFALRLAPGQYTLHGFDTSMHAVSVNLNVGDEGSVFDSRKSSFIVAPEATETTTTEKPQAGLASATVNAVAQAGTEQLNRCYNRWLRVNPNLAESVVLHVSVTGQGQVSDVVVDSRGDSLPQFTECVTTQAKEWRFPAPQNHASTTVRIPIAFRTGQ